MPSFPKGLLSSRMGARGINRCKDQKGREKGMGAKSRKGKKQSE